MKSTVFYIKCLQLKTCEQCKALMLYLTNRTLSESILVEILHRSESIMLSTISQFLLDSLYTEVPQGNQVSKFPKTCLYRGYVIKRILHITHHF